MMGVMRRTDFLLGKSTMVVTNNSLLLYPKMPGSLSKSSGFSLPLDVSKIKNSSYKKNAFLVVPLYRQNLFVIIIISTIEWTVVRGCQSLLGQFHGIRPPL